jgi:hypothetical protein
MTTSGALNASIPIMPAAFRLLATMDMPVKSYGFSEIHLEVAAGQDAHAADDDVKLSGEQGRNDAGPFGGDEFDPEPHVLGQTRGHVDFESR